MPRKRGQGEGSLRKRKDGNWEARITTGYDVNSQINLAAILTIN